MGKLEFLSADLNDRMEKENLMRTFQNFSFDEKKAMFRVEENIPKSVLNDAFGRDIEKIIHCPYFSRYADKTQVYSLFKNDDMTRRSLHVQFVSRIARTIGKALHLNLELIEAIALGHDIGHPAFAHTGESLLDKLYFQHTGRHFLHNIQSVRVLDKIHGYNLTLQTLHGIASHNGELELEEYHPVPVKDFTEFDSMMERCTLDKAYADKIMPSTLEGAVVRISDIIAYLGKDRQDAILAGGVNASDFENTELGVGNEEMVNNLIVNIIENSYGKPYIKLDHDHFVALKNAKQENYQKIYNSATALTGLNLAVVPMMEEVYGQLLDDVKNGCRNSPIFTHHIRQVNTLNPANAAEYEKGEANQLVVDYIASMTDDYFVELHQFLFPHSSHRLIYKGYFD
jgi:dGTPase